MPALHLTDDHALLDRMLQDGAGVPAHYAPGPYWHRASRNAARELRSHLTDFRAPTSVIGVNFADTPFVDTRLSLASGARRMLRPLLERVFPLNRLFAAQVDLTRSHEREVRRLRGELIARHPDVPGLLARYTLPYSLLGGCVDTLDLGGTTYSTHYLSLLQQHDHVARAVDHTRIRSMFEIGGGFGAHTHLLLENYPNIRKVVYLDIPPILYVGTQYLRAFYPEAVRDYTETRGVERIRFRADDSREILCVAPWQLERLDVGVDLIYNAHSFVEMPDATVTHYARQLAALPSYSRAAVALLTYGEFDARTTLSPDRLPTYFRGRSFRERRIPTLAAPKDVIAYLDPGAFGSRGVVDLIAAQVVT
jgi:putative sugar O-methyltransferase